MDFAEVMPTYPENEYGQEEEVYEEDNSDNNSDSDSSSEQDNNAEEDEDTYIKFVQSVFCDDYSGCSNDEEEDEEDYVPDPKEVDENDDDSDEDDRDLIRIQNRELRELVDGCWQTIVGEAPPVQPVIIKDDPIGEEIGSPQKSRAHQTHFDQKSPQNARSSSSRNGDQSSTNAASADICDELDGITEPAGSGNVLSNGAKLMPIPTGVSTGPNAISSMVSKLLLENDTTEVCVEGLPVTAIRNIVARQMSMATQLLTQILLQADQDSDCFTKGYTSLMELSNLREAALKKASLVQMNFRNATAIRNHTIDLQNQKRALHSIMGSDRSDRSDFNEDDGESENDSHSEEEKEEEEEGVEGEAVEDLLNMRNSVFGARNITNSTSSSRPASVLIGSSSSNETSLLNTTNSTTPGIAVDSMRRLTRSAVQHTTVHTMFNMPILGKVSTLFDMVDLSRRKIKQQLVYHRNNNQHNSIPGRGSNLRAQDQQADEKAALLHAIRGQIFRIMPKLQMRAWKCLLPTLHYPLPAPLMRSLDPSTLMGRCLFTPTEDDLLLRGIMYHTGDGDWEGIRAQYMPSKVAQTLQFRFTQMTSLTATMEDNNYKRFQKLESDYRNRDNKWGPDEELQLLRAFQVLGNRWPLVRIFFLPHRKVTQLKLKWTALQKTWQRAFQGGQAATPRIGYLRELTAPMRSFLEAISPEVSTLTPTALTLTPMSVASMVCAEPTGIHHTAMNNSNSNSNGRSGHSSNVSMDARHSVSSAIVPAGGLMNSSHNASNGTTNNSSGRPASANAPSTCTNTATAIMDISHNYNLTNNNNNNNNNSNGALRLPSISTLQVPSIMNTLALPFPNTTTTTTNNSTTSNTGNTAATAGNNTATTTAQQQQQQQQQHNQQQQLLQQQMQLQMHQYQQMYPYMPSFMMPGASLKMPTTQEEFVVYQQQMQFQQFMQQQQYQMFLHQQQQMMQQLNPSELNSGTNGLNNNNMPPQMQQQMQQQTQFQQQQQQLLAQHMQNINPNITPPIPATATAAINNNDNNSTTGANNSNNSNKAITGVTTNNTTTNNSVPLLSKPTTEQPTNSSNTSNNPGNNNTTSSNSTSSGNKRTRRIRPDLVSVDPELRSPSSSLQGLLQDKDARTNTSNGNTTGNNNQVNKSNKGSKGSSGRDSGTNSNSMSAAEDPQASRSVSFLSAPQYHDLYQNQHLSSNQDSIFSLLCAGDSVPFGEALSVPYLESSEQSSSSSNEPFPALSKQPHQNSGVPASLHHTNASTMNATTLNTAPTLKGILSKSPSKKKKKTIKPTLISAATATAGATASHVFDAPSTTNNNNLRSLSASNNNTKPSGTNTNSRSKAPLTVPNKTNNQQKTPHASSSNTAQQNNSNTLGSLYGEVSLSGLEGLSCLQWGDASQAAHESYSASNSASNSSGADDTRLSTLGGPILTEMSLLDASRFSFSNFAPPRFDTYSDDSHPANENSSSRAGKSASKNGSKNASKGNKKSTEDSQSGSKSGSKKNISQKKDSEGKNVSKKTANNPSSAAGGSSSSSQNALPKRTASAAASFHSPVRNNLGSPLRTMYTRSALSSPAGINGIGASSGGSADSGALYPFDETSNMSLLGDLFGDGDFSTHNSTGNTGYGNNLLSPLRSHHSKPPLHASWSSPQAQRRPSSVPEASVSVSASAQGGSGGSKKRPHSTVNNGAGNSGVNSGGPARPFQNISARPGIATQPSASASASQSTHSANYTSGSSSSNNRGFGPSPKKQKKAGGLFAEVMAKAQR